MKNTASFSNIPYDLIHFSGWNPRVFVRHFISLYGKLPIQISFDHVLKDSNKFSELIIEKFEIDEHDYYKEITCRNGCDLCQCLAVIANEIWVHVSREWENDDSSYVWILFSAEADIATVNKLVGFIKKHLAINRESNVNNTIKLLNFDINKGYYLKDHPVKTKIRSLNAYYNSTIEPFHKSMANFVRQKNHNGVALLTGNFGTGKTTYLRFLINKEPANYILFSPEGLVDITAPALLAFLLENKNSIIIVEDCEILVSSRGQGLYSMAISNLLNLSDGLMGDALHFRVICTFNLPFKSIDSAMIRKGRLAVHYEFGLLDKEKAEFLATKHRLKIKVNGPMSLAELFNPERGMENTGKRKVGFI